MSNLVVLLFISLTILLFFFFLTRTQRKLVPAFRPIEAYKAIQQAHARSVEGGKKMHLSLGTAGIAEQMSAETLAGLEVVDYLEQQSRNSGNPPLISMADPGSLVLTQSLIQQTYGADARGASLAQNRVRWISPEPAAYSAGVMGLLNQEDIEANVFLGHFGDEYLLIGEASQQQSPPQTTIAGASDPNVLPFVMATSQHGLWGEDMFAAGAYLSKKPAHIASLLTQDTLRWALGLTMLGGVLLKLLGVF